VSDIEALADELQDEIDRIAAESEETAEAIAEQAITAKKADIQVLELMVVWG
jgi:predicted transcriptional regulator